VTLREKAKLWTRDKTIAMDVAKMTLITAQGKEAESEEQKKDSGFTGVLLCFSVPTPALPGSGYRSIISGLVFHVFILFPEYTRST
jgi:hypothetical protein